LSWTLKLNSSEELDAQVARHDAHWVWTKGHASHEDNNRADELASVAARQQCSQT